MTLTVRYWMTDGSHPERETTRDEWTAGAAAAGAPSNAGYWSTGHTSGRLEYVLPEGAHHA